LLYWRTIIELESADYICDALASRIPLVSIPDINQVVIARIVLLDLQVNHLPRLPGQGVVVEANLIVLRVLDGPVEYISRVVRYQEVSEVSQAWKDQLLLVAPIFEGSLPPAAVDIKKMIKARLPRVGQVVLVLDHGRWSPVGRDALARWIHAHAVRVTHIAAFGGRSLLVSLWVKFVQSTVLHGTRGISDIRDLGQTHVALILLEVDCLRCLN